MANINTFLKNLRNKTGCTSMKQSRYGDVSTWISTGSLALNRIISGSIKKGIPSGRITVINGQSQTGKSLLAALVMSNALKDGFDHIFYFDSEGGGTAQFFQNTGCDVSKIEQILVENVEDAQLKILEVYNGILQLKKQVKEGEKEPKFLCVLDSLGALVAEKVLRDADKGKVASQMGGRAKQCLTGDTLVLMSDNTYKQIKDIKVGDLVYSGKNNIKRVIDVITSQHKKYLRFTLSTGQVINMSFNHKMLVERDKVLEYKEGKDILITDNFITNCKSEKLAICRLIKKIEVITEDVELYDIEVQDDHTFCITTDNIISHNCNNLMKAITIPALKTDTAMLVLNHVYDDPSSLFASKIMRQSGGKGLQYQCSINIQCTRLLQKDQDKDSEQFYGGTHLKFFTVKNRFARPSLECDVYLDFKKGFIRPFESLWDEAIRGGFILNPKQGYYTVPSSSDPEKCYRQSQLVNNVEIWKTFLTKFQEWSKQDLAYKSLQQSQDDLQNNLEQSIDVPKEQQQK